MAWVENAPRYAISGERARPVPVRIWGGERVMQPSNSAGRSQARKNAEGKKYEQTAVCKVDNVAQFATRVFWRWREQVTAAGDVDGYWLAQWSRRKANEGER